MAATSMLIIFGGLPGVGKTSIARERARQLAAVYLRMDSIEQALRDSGRVNEPFYDAGYRVGYAVAEDYLRLARTVIADSVNPAMLGWLLPLAPKRALWKSRLCVVISSSISGAWRHARPTSAD